MYHQISEGMSHAVDLQHYLSSSIHIGEKVLDYHQSCHTVKPTGMHGIETTHTVNELKTMNVQHEEDKEKLKLIVSEQQELIQQQHSTIEQYQKEITNLKIVNESLIKTSYPTASAKHKPNAKWSSHYRVEQNTASAAGNDETPPVLPVIIQRDSKYDTRLYKKGWSPSDKDLLKLRFSGFIEGEIKYPSTSEVDNFLSTNPEFLAPFDFSEKQKKNKLRSQLNNMKKMREKQRQKLMEQQDIAPPIVIPDQPSLPS